MKILRYLILTLVIAHSFLPCAFTAKRRLPRPLPRETKEVDEDFTDNILFAAVKNGHHIYVQVVLNKGANPDVRNQDGMTPLMIAAQRGDIKMMKVLLGAKADVNAVSYRGQTAYSLVVYDAPQEQKEACINLLGRFRVRGGARDRGSFRGIKKSLPPILEPSAGVKGQGAIELFPR